MDKITLIKKNTGDNDELACENCVFHGACMQTLDMPAPFGEGHCLDGDYWEFEK